MVNFLSMPQIAGSMVTKGPFYKHGLTLITVLMNTFSIKCGMKCLLHSQTPTMQPLSCRNGLNFTPHFSGSILGLKLFDVKKKGRAPRGSHMGSPRLTPCRSVPRYLWQVWGLVEGITGISGTCSNRIYSYLVKSAYQKRYVQNWSLSDSQIFTGFIYYWQS